MKDAIGGGYVIAIGLVVLGVFSFSVALKADERERDNIKARADAMLHRVQHEQAVINLEDARKRSELQQQLEQKRIETELMRQGIAQQQLLQQLQEMALRGYYLSIAQQRGVTVDDIIANNRQKMADELEINKKKKLDELDTDKEWAELQNTLRGIEISALSGNQQVKELYRDLQDAVRELVAVNQSKQPKYAKQPLIDTSNSLIASLMRQINEIQAGLTETQNRKNPRRTQKTASNSRASHTP